MEGPIRLEAYPIIPGLLPLHDYGFLTTQYKPFKNDGPDVVADEEDWSSVWCEQKQRPWLQFLIPRDNTRISAKKIKKFCNKLMKEQHIMVKIADNDTEKFSQNFDIDEDGTLILTEGRRAASREELLKQKMTILYLTPRWNQHEGAEWQDYTWPAVESTRPLEVDIVARSWEENLDLQALVEELALSVGMTRVYAEGS